LPNTYRFALQTLQREIGSSPLAARSTLLALAELPALSEQRLALNALAERAARVTTGPRPTRWRSCWRAWAARRCCSSLTFARRWSNCAAAGWLGLDFVVYHGGLSAAAKMPPCDGSRARRSCCCRPRRRARAQLAVLRTLVNFDLPDRCASSSGWPGARIGQTRPVEIHNLSPRHDRRLLARTAGWQGEYV